MHEFDTVSVSSFEASSLAGRLTEKSSEGWDVVSIVAAGSEVVAYLRRATGGTDTATTSDSAVADAGSDAMASTPVQTPDEVAEPAGWGAAPDPTPTGSSWGATTSTPAADTTTTWGSSASSAPASDTTSSWSSSAATAPAAATTPSVPPGWYADPAGRFELRYWDGSAWTEHVARAGQQYTDPPVA